MFYWVIGLLISLAGISVYLEFASYFPSRSGAEVVYLEQAYAKPKYFFPIAFAVQTVILSFVSSNVIGQSLRLHVHDDVLTHSRGPVHIPDVRPHADQLGVESRRSRRSDRHHPS